MRVTTNTLKQFTAMRESLVAEKATIEARLKELNEALGEESSESASSPPKGGSKSVTVNSRKGPRAGKISLRSAVLQATKDGPMTKEEILKAVRKIGYRFTTANPMGYLRAVIYRKQDFKNEGGKFSPAERESR